MIKKTLTLLTAIVLGVINAHANLGDSIEQSNAKYGTPRITDYYYNYIKGNWNISTGFEIKGEHCVYISYSHEDGSNLTDNEIATLLKANDIEPNHKLHLYTNKKNAWWNGDLLYALYYYETQENGRGNVRTVPTLRITNEATMQALGLFEKSNTNNDVNAI